MSTWARALAPLCGTLLGVMVYAHFLPGWCLPVLGGIGILAIVVGRSVLKRSPPLSALILTPWILCGIVLLAAITMILLWLTLHSARVFPYVTPEKQKELASALTGALTVFFGVVFTKNLEEGGGFFWPGTQFKRGIKTAFETRLKKPVDYTDTEVSEAVLSDFVRANTPRKRVTGWGLRARLVRARIITDSFPGNSPPPAADSAADKVTEAPSAPAEVKRENPPSNA